MMPIFVNEIDYRHLPWELARYQGYVIHDHDVSGLQFPDWAGYISYHIPLPDPLPPIPLSPLGQIRERIMSDGIDFKEQASLVLRLKNLLHLPDTREQTVNLLSQLRDRPWIRQELATIVDDILAERLFTKELSIPFIIHAEPAQMESENTCFYTTSKGDQGIVITPHLPYLDRILAGCPVESILLSPRFPKINARLVNNTTQTLFFTEALLHIEQSQADEYPLLICWNNHDDGATLMIENYGWSRAHNIEIIFTSFPDIEQSSASSQSSSTKQ
jgi:hypothetical protein